MDSNKEWLKKARAKRIAKIQRRRRIDNYIRGRVYMIILALIITFGVLLITLNRISQQEDDMATLHTTMGVLLTKTANDKLLKQNFRLVRVIDSLQIMIFAYNRRHQSDVKTIEALINGKRPKTVVNVLEFPEYTDSTKYDFEFDTISGTYNDKNELILDSNINFNKNEEDYNNSVDSNSNN